jgi:ABC-type nitrate/sulfonate/bicarbonate transport system ATPase subunit
MKLQIEDLVYAYQDGLVIDHLSLTVDEGEFVSLIGPSGSGKSSLFYVLGGLYRPQAGRIRLDGQEINGQTGKIGYMPQQPALLPWKTVAENIRFALMANPQAKVSFDLHALLQKAHLEGTEGKYPHQLSGGMQQRVSLLRTLASQQSLLCLDEPFAALDAITRQEMQRWLAELLLQERRTILFVTHSVEEALLLSDRLYVLTARPLRIKKEFINPFAQEERFERRSDPSFLQLRHEIEQRL